jgi:FkbM family methyltransferase
MFDFRKLFIWFFVSCIPIFATASNMECTGNITPLNYHYFNLPSDIVPFLSQFLPENPVIIEAGAYDGRESCMLAQFWRKGHVHSFEPVSELYRKVAAITSRYPNITSYQLALGSETGSKTLFLSSEPGNTKSVSMSSSLYPPKDHLLYSTMIFHGKEVVNSITLDDWAKKNGIEKVDLLWLDMQGFELPALKAGTKVLSNVSVIIIELEFVEAYEGQPLYREVKSWLESQGFVLVAGNFTFPKNPNQWFGDGVFVRKEKVK